MLRTYCITLVYILVMLPLNSIWGQQTPEQQLMRLVRVYEQAQDSAFLPQPTSSSVASLAQFAIQSEQIHQALPLTADSNILRVADYLCMATRIYAVAAQTLNYQTDSLARSQLKALRPAVDAYTPEDFPMRFTVMGASVVMRYESIVRDLRLYYNALVPWCSCRELRTLILHLRVLKEVELSDQWGKTYRKKCRRRI